MDTGRSDIILFCLFHNKFKYLQTVICGFRDTCVVAEQCDNFPVFVLFLCHDREDRIDLITLAGNRIEIRCEEAYVTGIDFAEEYPEEKEQQERTEVSDEAARQLEEYFQGKRKTFKLPLKLKGTEFQKLVWDALLTIPYGETRSYSEIACQIGRPKASRAVGMANHRNPVAIVVPCHRVIGKNGSLTGYAGGLDKKEKLLDLERRNR